MRLISLTMPNRAGEVEVIGIADVARKEVNFRTILNGTAFFESQFYDEAREVALIIFDINKIIQERAN